MSRASRHALRRASIGAAAFVAFAAWPAVTSAQNAGPTPAPCNGILIPSEGYYQASGPAGPGCLIQGTGGFAIGPKVVHVGEHITGSLTSTPDPGLRPTWDWREFVATMGDGHVVSGCQPMAMSCTVRAARSAVRDRWYVYVHTVNDNGTIVIGPSVSSDYILVNNRFFELSGTVTQQSKPVPNVEVDAVGRGGRHRATTDASGRYFIPLERGHYNVEVVGTAGAHAVPTQEHVHLTGDRRNVNFELNAKDVIGFNFSPLDTSTNGVATIEDATGLFGTTPLGDTGAVSSDTSVTDAAGNPVSVTVRFAPTASHPRALVCGPNGLLYPQLSGGQLSFNPFAVPTQAGHVLFNVWAGSEPGDWTFDASETNTQNPQSQLAALKFSVNRAASIPDIAQALYNKVRAIAGNTSSGLFTLSTRGSWGTPGLFGARRNAAQAALLAFLTSNFGAFGPTDFGPIHTNSTTLQSGRAAILFYNAAGQTQVLDMDVATDIVDAAGTGQPIPPGEDPLPTLAQYEHVFGPTFPGHLFADPSDALTYFGFPYPPLDEDGAVDANFYNHCVNPDTQAVRVEIDSPVNALFTNSAGQGFGIGPGGKPGSDGTGFEKTFPGGRKTFVLPAQSYRVTLTGTGKGKAHILIFSAGGTAERTQVFSFRVRKGQKGSVTLSQQGATGVLSFGGHRYHAAAGLRLRLRASRKHIRHNHLNTLSIHVTDELGRPVPGAVVVALEGRSGLAATLANRRGVARLKLKPRKKGRIQIVVAAPGTLGARLAVRAS